MRVPSRRQILLGSLASLLRAQEEAVFSTNVRVVNILATVRSKNGEIIRNLSKDDFEVTENGKPQTIKYFSQESDLPLTIGLMVDTSMSQEKVLNAERGASLQFFDQVLRDGKDQVFILQFDMAIVMRQVLTTSHRSLGDALSLVDTPSRGELMMQQGGGTLLYDAIIQACREQMEKLQGRKALILLTDGVDIGSQATVSDAIEAAQKADTLIYSILFADSGAYGIFGGSHDGKGVLMRLARETGGSFFEVSKKRSIGQIYAAIEDELRSQYSIGYVSDDPVRISEFRKLHLSAKQKNFTVQARDRYWAKR